MLRVRLGRRLGVSGPKYHVAVTSGLVERSVAIVHLPFCSYGRLCFFCVVLSAQV